jgi:hypothetical protein
MLLVPERIFAALTVIFFMARIQKLLRQIPNWSGVSVPEVAELSIVAMFAIPILQRKNANGNWKKSNFRKRHSY